MRLNLNELLQKISGSHITVEKHPKANFSIYGYHRKFTSKEKNTWNNYTKLCRGLILDDLGNVIERPFEKFWTFRRHLSENVIVMSENRLLKLPNEEPRIFEKLDGTMGILYWIDDYPYMASQRSFISLKAIHGSQIIQNKYLDVCRKLDRQYTYIFEVIFPQNSLIVNYGNMHDIVLIGVIDKHTGLSKPVSDKYGFSIKKDLTSEYRGFKSLNDLEELNIKNMEGLVLEYNTGERIKIKFPWYKKIHNELQKIVNAEFQKAESIRILKEYFEISANRLSSNAIFEALDRGDNDLTLLRHRMNMFQVDKGVDSWIKRHHQNIIEKGDTMFEYFDSSVESSSTPDNTLWNWKEVFLNYYYD